MEPKLPNFIIIDDDKINNLICKRVIARHHPECLVKSFEAPEEGLEYLEKSSVLEKETILFLDINMPGLSGWDVLEELHKFPGGYLQNLKIYMLSSSIDASDKQKANNDPLVRDYFAKPLTLSHLDISAVTC